MPDIDSNGYTGFEIAVIGMAGRFPGASDIDTFWENVKNGVESISFFSDEELLSSGVDEQLLDHPDFVKAGGVIEGKEYFDSRFFGYLPDEARVMDPQIRLFHQCAWEALEDAGCDPTGYEGAIGLYAGAGSSFNWEAYSMLSGIGASLDVFTASQLRDRTSLAMVVSYKLNLKGPVFTLHTACSTSLAAAHQACQALICGECDMAVAGGVSLVNASQRGYIYKEGMILSPDGHCRAFDAGAKGIISGEGAAVTVLKPLDNAVKEGDNIHAVIKGSYINNDGVRKVGYTAPSVEGQAEVIRNALSAAGVEPESITYIETHGTGTVLGDPIEVEALNNVFVIGKSSGKYCALGSLKTNTGHMDTAAGAAGLIKTVLALKHRRIPPSLHFNTPNPKIDFENSPFYVNTTLKKWENHKYPLRAGVSSFGIGGTNVHVVLEECPETYNKEASSPSRQYQLIMFSAKTASALDRMTENVKEYLKKNLVNPANPANPGLNLADAAYTLQTGRPVFPYRRMFVCKDTREAVDILSSPGLEKVKTFTAGKEINSIVFMFSGQGGQYVDMGRELYQNEPLFRQEMDGCFEILEPLLDYDLREILYPGEMQDRSYIPGINQTEITQPLLFVFEYSLAKLVMQWGITPDAMIGYSYGEYVAACLAGVFSLEQALNLVVLRGKLTAALPPGAMLSVPLTEEELLPLLNDELSLAIVNGPSCIVAGSEEAAAAFEKQMKQRKLLCIRVGLTHAAHSARMEAISGEFEKHVGKIPLGTPKIPYISNVSGTWIKDDEAADPGYWSTHLKSTVRFARGLEELLKAAGSVFIEIGPGKALSNFVRQHPAKTARHLVVNLVRDKNERKPDLYYLADRLGRLWLYGVEIDWQQFYREEKRKKVSLPTYPFEKIEYPLGRNVFQLVSGMLKNRGEAAHVDVDGMPAGFTFAEPGITVERPELVTSYIEPSTPTERALVEMWQNFFGVGGIGIADDFFELGGDSLKAMTLLAKIHQRFDVEILLTEFFADSTVKDLAHRIDSSIKREFVLIEPVEEKEYYPLSPAQKRLYILQQMVRGSTVYNLPQFIPFGQDADGERLKRVFAQLIRRHESLRTSFHMVNKEPVQRVHDEVELTVEAFNYDAQGGAFIRAFDLSRAPLIRCGLGKTNQGNYLLMVDMHHIISDGVSLNLLEKEFKSLYGHPGNQLPGLRLQYKDFSQWQRREEWQGAIKKQEKYWLKEFPGELPVLDLAADFQRPVVQSFEGSNLNFYLGGEETGQLKKLAREHHVTFYMVLLGVFNILLAKMSGQEDIIVGTGVAGRRHPDLEKIIGMFVNTLPLRSRPARTKTLPVFLEEIKNKTLSAFENQEYPFEDLIEKISVPRDTGRNPLFDVLFILQSQAEYGGEIPGDTDKITYGGDFVAKFDITLNAVELDNGLLFAFEYCTKIFNVDTIERFAGFLKRIISSVIQDPEQRLSEIDILSTREREQLIHDFNDTYGGCATTKTLHELFEEQAARTPGRTAAVGSESKSRETVQLTYRELNQTSDQVALLLKEKGVLTDNIIGIMVERSIEMIIGILGILKAGGAYLPIDPEYPQERIDFMLKDSGVTILLTDLPEGRSFHHSSLIIHHSPNNLAYVIYTSGTTGKPKGTLTTHRNVARVVKNTNYIELTENDRVLQLSNYAFDGSVFDIYGALLNGAALVLVGKEEVFDVDKLSRLITRENITLFFVTTALFNTLVDLDIGCLTNVRKILFGGERVSVEHTLRALEFLGKDRIMHMYGPTETTVYASSYNINSIEKGAVTVPIGGPISRTSIYILNENLNPQPIGVKGEIYIGGEGVAWGYLNNPELTSEKFLSVSYRSYRSYISKKIYKTGDLARWLPGGNIEFIGRIDKQVKIRGFRVEPGEIENRLLRRDEIKEAVVTFSGTYLCAFYVTVEKTVNTPGSVELKEYLSHTLPNYMIPTHFIRVEKMPLTPNGKVDIKALPRPTAVSDVQYAAPENEVEKRLVEIWWELLDQPHHSIGIDDNFFDLGGHSLKAAIMAAEIHKEFNVRLPLEVIFRETTIRKLSQTIEGSTETQYASIKPAETREYYALSSAQKRMYVLQQMNINNTSYNISAAMPIEGRIDRKRLEETFRKLIKRHENFRTSFEMLNGQPVQRIHQEVDFEIEYYEALSTEHFIRPFDLSGAPLLRVRLTKLEENKHLLTADMHHIISDGTSQQILTRDFLALYTGHEPKPLRLQYKDFSIWQNALFAPGKIENQEKYWLNLYEDEIPKLDLPVDYPRPGIFTFAGAKEITLRYS
jgi:amino acid adenylation domain-containing protein